MSHRNDEDLCLGPGEFPPPLWAIFRGKHYIRSYEHPEPARLAVRSWKNGRVIPYLPAVPNPGLVLQSVEQAC